MITAKSDNIIISYLDKFRGLSWQVWFGLAAVFTNSLGTASTLFLSLFFMAQLHFSVTEAGIFITAFGVGAIFGSYSSGHLCNRYSSHIISILSLIINAITLFIISFLTDFAALLVVIAIMGASNSAFIPANRVWLMRKCNENQKIRVNSLRFMIVNLGMGIAIFIGGFLAKYSYTLLFSFNAGAVLLSAVILMVLGQPEDKLYLYSETPSKKLLSKLGFFEDRGIFYTYITLLFVSLIFAQLRITYPIYLKSEYHLNTQLFSYLFLINTIFIVLFQVHIVDYVSRFNQFIIVAVGSFLVGLGMFMLIFGESYLLAVGSCFIWTIGEILAFPIIQVLLYDRASQSTKAIHMGLYQAVYSFANVIGPILGSWAYQFQNGFGVWLLSGFLGLACLLIGFRTKSI